MSSVIQPQCSTCSKTDSIYWYRKGDSILCSECNKPPEPICNKVKEPLPETKRTSSRPKFVAKRTTRSSANSKAKPSTPNAAQKKGKGRRSLYFKKLCMKAPRAVATVVTSKSILYKDQLYTVGDIVSVCDAENNIYYCQLRGFMTDQYCEKSGVITWLVPSDRSPPPEERFDPTTYMLGVEEEFPRKMECFNFVMHAPAEFYKPIMNTFPPPTDLEHTPRISMPEYMQSD